MKLKNICTCRGGERQTFLTEKDAINEKKTVYPQREAIVMRCTDCDGYTLIPLDSMINSHVNGGIEVLENEEPDTFHCRKPDRSLREFFRTQEDAEKQAAHIGRCIGVKQYAYSCPKCDYWHYWPWYQSICTHCDKPAYSTEEHAKNAQKLASKNSNQGPNLNVYCCAYGSGYHLTKKS